MILYSSCQLIRRTDVKLIRAAPVLLLILTGCTLTGIDEVRTGLFKDDLKKLWEAYQVVSQKDRGTLATEDLQGMGFRLDAPNVQRISGPPTFRKIFGENVFQGALAETKDGGSVESRTDALLKEMNRYHAFFIPYKYIVTEEDRIYFTTRETTQKGDDLLILFMFKNDKLVYCDYEYVKIDAKSSKSAFAQGLVEFIDKYGGFGASMNSVIEKIKELIK